MFDIETLGHDISGLKEGCFLPSQYLKVAVNYRRVGSK